MSGKDSNNTDRRSILKDVNAGHNMFGDNSEASAERRPLLKGLGLSLGAILGPSGAAAGSSEETSKMQRKTEAAIEGYETTAGVKKALNEHANGLLAVLAESGFSKSIETADLTPDDVEVLRAPAEVDPVEGTYVTASEHEGEFTAHVSIIRKTATFVVRINVQPQLDRSFATIKSRNGKILAIVDPSAGGDLSSVAAEDDDASIQKVCGSDGYTCPPGACCTYCGTKQVKHERTCCKYADGSVDCYEEPIDQCCDPLVCC